MMIDLSKDQCESLIDLIENNLFDIIRTDDEIDNIKWLYNIMSAYKTMSEAVNDV